MGRPRKIRESTGKEFRTDRELVRQYQYNKKREDNLLALKRLKKDDKIKLAKVKRKKDEASSELWDKFFLLRMKMRGQLAKVCRENNLYYPELYEEYDSEAWEKFIKQIDGIRLKDVEHHPNWSMHIRIWGYWRSMNRDLLKKWFEWNGHVTPITSIIKNDGKNTGNENLTNIDVEVSKHYQDMDDAMIVNTGKEILWKSIEVLTEQLTPSQKKLLNLRYQGAKNRDIISKLKIDGKNLKEQIDFLKESLNVIIMKVSKEKGMPTNYTNLVTILGGV